MAIARRLMITLMTVGAAAGFSLAASSVAVELSDGRVAFNSPPRMIDTAVSPKRTRASNGTFRMSFTVPDNAGEPLHRVEIVPFSGVETIGFRLDNTYAYNGDSIRGGDPIGISAESLQAANGRGDDAAAIAVNFDPPVLPGNTVTVVLKSRRNPRIGGTYRYSVTVFPRVQNGIGQFMGYAAFSFNEMSDCDRLFC